MNGMKPYAYPEPNKYYSTCVLLLCSYTTTGISQNVVGA